MNKDANSHENLNLDDIAHDAFLLDIKVAAILGSGTRRPNNVNKEAIRELIHDYDQNIAALKNKFL